MSRRQWIAALVAVLALAAFLRFWRLRDLPPGLYADEAMNGNNAMEALETRRFAVFYPENNGREGLYIDLAAVSIECFGNQAWALRIPAAIFGVLTVAGLACLGAELYGDAVGWFAAFFLTTSFWHILLSREGLRAIAAPCFLVWSIYLLLAARRRMPLVALAGAVYGLGFYTYIAYRATPLLMVLLLRRVGWKRAAVFAAAAAVVVAPLAMYFATHPGTFFGRTSQLSVWRAGRPAPVAGREAVLNIWRTARMFFTHGDYNWRHNYPWRAEVFWPVALLLVIGVICRRKGKWVPLVWLAVAALPVVLSGQDIPHALRSILMLPAAMLLAGLGAQRAYEFAARHLPGRVLAAGTAIALALLAYEPYHTYFDLWGRNPEMPGAFDIDSVRLAHEIQALPRETEKYVVIPPGADMAPQPVMFLTASYTPRQQDISHIHYLADSDCGRAKAKLAGAQVFCLTLANGSPDSDVHSDVLH